jgi:hypothetical protein
MYIRCMSESRLVLSLSLALPAPPGCWSLLVLVGHVTLPAPHASSLSVSLFLFSSPFSMLLVWTAPAGVYVSRYSSRRQAPRLRTLPLLFLQFKPNVALTHHRHDTAPSPGTSRDSPRRAKPRSSWARLARLARRLWCYPLSRLHCVQLYG